MHKTADKDRDISVHWPGQWSLHFTLEVKDHQSYKMAFFHSLTCQVSTAASVWRGPLLNETSVCHSGCLSQACRKVRFDQQWLFWPASLVPVTWPGVKGHIPLEQAAWGGLLHLSQGLHGQNLHHIHDHPWNLPEHTAQYASSPWVLYLLLSCVLCIVWCIGNYATSGIFPVIKYTCMYISGICVPYLIYIVVHHEYLCTF